NIGEPSRFTKSADDDGAETVDGISPKPILYAERPLPVDEAAVLFRAPVMQAAQQYPRQCHAEKAALLLFLQAPPTLILRQTEAGIDVLDMRKIGKGRDAEQFGRSADDAWRE